MTKNKYRAVLGLESNFLCAHGFIYYPDKEQNDYDPDFDEHPDGLYHEPATWWGGIGKQLFTILWSICVWFDSWMLPKRGVNP